MNRMKSLSSWLKKEDIQGAFIHTKENVFYLSGYFTEPHERVMGLFVFQEAEPFFILPKMEVEQAKNAGWSGDIIGYEDHENPFDFIQLAIEKRGVQAARLAIEKESIPLQRAEQLQAVTGAETFVRAEEKLNQLRLIKDESEIATLKKAAELADEGVKIGVNALKEGITETEVLAVIEYELKKKGIQGMSFSTMVLFGEKSGEPHGNPGQAALKKGDFVLFDLGVIVDGYCSDITRTFIYQEASEKQKDIYQTVLNAEMAALEMSKPGVRIGDLDLKARGLITEAGYGEYFPHRLGHGLGVSVHEFPSMSQANDDLLQEGMVYTIEPGIYVPGVGGVRIEDDVLITADGPVTLTNYPKELTIIK
ncbi:M24 family metallopeptidase [Bacillus safensis]|uniref:M24 family metallopeptidase n=1 Tax=Bacillus safensis TaxID=561879 RepID=UPI002280E1AC|nr:Xaa-Pro peptidase family protein [Bacillus safensis]MCY7675221.1 Xaa-Pro peptidase family protein [Bacillus safensis]MCY7699908.1 Xaa-Pro peptidase family protein [Bacillus safensis]MEC3627080.1 Xaa-Pro peptidase family protein [Bacillus safensis]